MTLFYYDPVFMEHNTKEHPENAGRLRAVMRHLSFVGLDSMCKRPAWEPVSQDRLQRVHVPAYIDSLEQLAASGGGLADADTVLSERSFEVALMATGAVCDAVVRVIDGDAENAFCLLRPPGHHALSDRAMGFCLFNHVAVAARVAQQEKNLQRVLIVDFDVHHGNGTQAIFWKDPSVGYLSMHREPFYPGTGSADETGGGLGTGTTLNLPIRFGTSRESQLQQFSEQVHAFAAKIDPELILISAGFDSHQDDPIGSLGLKTEDFRTMTHVMKDIAARHCSGRLVSVLEGGYNPHALAECVTVHLEELLHD